MVFLFSQVQCYVRAATLAGITYAWTYDDQPIAGQEDHTLQINGASDAGHGKKGFIISSYCLFQENIITILFRLSIVVNSRRRHMLEDSRLWRPF